MRTTIVCATFLSFGAGMAGVGALNNVALMGSDSIGFLPVFGYGSVSIETEPTRLPRPVA
jgi:hypothetical protein